jgi:hypothetical protein
MILQFSRGARTALQRPASIEVGSWSTLNRSDPERSRVIRRRWKTARPQESLPAVRFGPMSMLRRSSPARRPARSAAFGDDSARHLHPAQDPNRQPRDSHDHKDPLHGRQSRQPRPPRRRMRRASGRLVRVRVHRLIVAGHTLKACALSLIEKERLRERHQHRQAPNEVATKGEVVPGARRPAALGNRGLSQFPLLGIVPLQVPGEHDAR